MKEIVVRFLVGGLVVSAFSVIGDMFKPKSFGGLFGAAPSVALSTLGLTVAANGRDYAAMEARSMLAGSVAFFLYASCVSWILMHYKVKALWVTIVAMPVWLVAAGGLWCVGFKS
jgi:hypothetical protein